MRKAIQIISIGLAAYNLYLLVTDFLETPAGQKVKEKAEPWIEEAVEQAKAYVEKVHIPSKDEIKAHVEKI